MEHSYIYANRRDNTNDKALSDIVNSITILPKNFCIVKIWTKTCDYQSATIIKPFKDLIVPQGCLLKNTKRNIIKQINNIS